MPKLAMVCNWDTAYQPVEDIILPNRREYAKHAGYTLYEYNYIGHWGKLEALLDAWHSADYLWWLDFDALITGRQTLDHLLDGRFVISCDYNGLNTGSFIVPTTQVFFDIFSDCLAKRDFFTWDNNWHDQNAICFQLWRVNHLVNVVPQSTFNSYPIESGGPTFWKHGDLVLHCPGIATLEIRRQIFERYSTINAQQHNDTIT